MQNKILIIKLSAFGDIIQSFGAIEDLKNHHQNDEIIVMTTPPYEKLFRRCPWVDSVIIDPRAPRWRLDKMRTLQKKVFELKPDLVYDLQRVGRTR
ncbi:MAG: hypothetical protein OEM02_01580, partial [Desulfobulbaceae bacterium]|nr:hypothetical protein [Desulfobulbaceae bacterium]